MSEELGSCPACGGKRADPSHRHGGQYSVICPDCYMLGPRCKTVEGAIAAWGALPRALVWTTEPPQLSAWNWWRLDAEARPVCRYVYSDGSIGNLMVGRIAWQDIGGQWCPIPEPQGSNND